MHHRIGDNPTGSRILWKRPIRSTTQASCWGTNSTTVFMGRLEAHRCCAGVDRPGTLLPECCKKKKKHNKHQVRCLTQVLAYPALAPVHRGCSEERGLAHWCGVADSHSCDTESSCACDEDLSSFTTVQEVQKEKSIIMEDFFCEIFNYMSIYPLITHMYIIQ